jgi:hypothetical protein
MTNDKLEDIKAARDDFIHIDECENLYENQIDVFVIDARHADLIRTLLDQAIQDAEIQKHSDEFFDCINEKFQDALEKGRKQLDEIADRAKAINAPDLDELRKTIHERLPQREYDRRQGWNAAIDHLAPRIVRDGCVVVPLEPTQKMIDAAKNRKEQSDLYPDIYKAMIAASKGD